jgi:pyrroline-5-carboxylate reductase
MKVGIIGAGNMGRALVRGLTKSGMSPSNIMVSDPDERKLQQISELGVLTTTDNSKLAKWADVVILAVKPSTVQEVLTRISPELEEKLLISVAAGVTLATLERLTGARVVRLMPNLCAEVCEMTGCYALGNRATAEDESVIKALFDKIGCVFRVDESLMSAVTGLSGSGPAFFSRLIQAAAAAGTELGLPPDIAKKLAAQTARGTASMILNGADPGELTSRVCTPGGTTERGMKALESGRAPEVLKEAIRAATRRADELSR